MEALRRHVPPPPLPPAPAQGDALDAAGGAPPAAAAAAAGARQPAQTGFTSVLVAGCGNSTLGYDMWADLGYPRVVNVDYVPSVVRLMAARYSVAGAVEWAVGDLTDMRGSVADAARTPPPARASPRPGPSGGPAAAAADGGSRGGSSGSGSGGRDAYDLVVDKATLDAFMAPSPGEERHRRSSAAQQATAYKYLAEMHRVTAPHGRLAIVTLMGPGAMQQLLIRAAAAAAAPAAGQRHEGGGGWGVAAHEEVQGGRDGQAVAANLYICTKASAPLIPLHC